MGTKVFKVQFYKSSYQLNDEYDRLSYIEMDRIAELDSESFFDFDDDNNRYTIYVITTLLEIKQYLCILANNFIKYELTDISNEILNNRIDLGENLKEQLNTINSIKYSFFIDDIDSWIYQNIDMDIILDRISEFGIKSLTSVEKDYLKAYNIN